MSMTRTGWVDLFTAQVLWAKVISTSSGCPIKLAPANSVSSCIRPVEGQNLPTTMAEALEEMADRTALVARCTCDLCGMPALYAAKDSHSVRCKEHLTAPTGLSALDVDDLMTFDDPLAEVESMAASCVDLALLGPVRFIQDLLVSNQNLYTACCTRHELLAMADPWAPWVAHAVALADLEYPQRGRARLRYFDGRNVTTKKLWNLKELLAECSDASEAAGLLLKRPMLLAATRTCMRYGNGVLGAKVPQVLALVDAELARRAIAKIV